MEDLGIVIATLGGLLVLGLAGDLLSKRLPVPRVTLLIVFGVLIGSSGFGLLPVDAEDWFPLISNVALLMVGFLLGGKLSLPNLRRIGKLVLGISAFEVLGATLFVFLGLWLMGAPLPLAVAVAGIAPASAPAAVTNVVEESRAQGTYTDTLLGIVAIDDAWGLIVFSLLLALAQSITGGAGGSSAFEALQQGGWELGGALLIGLAVGVPAAWLTRRLRPGQAIQAEVLGVVLLAGGLALWLEVSYLLTALVVGATIVNLASEDERPFRQIEYMEWPFMILFFLLAGASLHIDKLAGIGWIGLVYIVARAAGLMAGAYLGGRATGANSRIRRWMGIAIMPQAGVALGMALVASHALPQHQGSILPLLVGTTVVFELVGPIFTRMALIRSGETGRAAEPF